MELRGLAGLRVRRERAGLTQAQLAAQIGVQRTNITNWENGVSWPAAGMLPKIADTLLCSIDDLYNNFTEETEPCQSGGTLPTSTQGTEPVPV